MNSETARVVREIVRETKLTPTEAVSALEGTLRRAKNILIDRCRPPHQSDAFEIPDRRFDRQEEQIALGSCVDRSSGGDGGGAGASPGPARDPDAYAGQVRTCMNSFWEGVERRTGDQCGSGMFADGEATTEQVGNVKTETHSYTDENGDEHLAIIETSDSSGDTKVTEISCSGACQSDGQGGYSNANSKETTFYRDNGDGTGYVTTIDKDGNVHGRPWGSSDAGDTKADVGDAAGSTDTSSQAKKDWEDCLFTPGCDPGQRPQDCVAIPVNGGPEIMYLVHSAESPRPSDRFPATALDALAGCMCAARGNSGGSIMPDVLGPIDSSCATAEDQERMRCMSLPGGPDDAPLKCAAAAEVDLAAVAQTRCGLMLCPEGSFRTLTPGAQTDACGCGCRTFLEGFFQGQSDSRCAQMMCAEGSCVCGATGCGCSSGGFTAPVAPQPGGGSGTVPGSIGGAPAREP